ncbi:MAG TPA: two-component regulator propeller domain-containing protein, partial [bacterium]|nr:two-component regulator propeller domain-containing protein [bacterium]
MRRRARIHHLTGLLLLMALGIGRPAVAAGPQQRSWKSFSDFLPCQLENVSLESTGRLVLAPQTRLVIDSGEPYIWDITSDPAGVLYLATGNQGRVFRVAGNGDTTLCFAASEPEIYALAEDGRGGLYIASSPNGRIYRRDATGAVRVFCEPGQTYIWDMLFDRAGDLWVATGGKAQLLRVNPAGQISVVLNSEAEHIRCLTLAGEILYAGSSRPGLIYRIRKNDTPFVLYDTGVEE